MNINGYTVDDNVNLNDDLLDISSGSTLVFLGESALTDDEIAGAGRVSVRGPMTIDDNLTLTGSTVLVNAGAITQTNGVSLGSADLNTLQLGTSSDDTVVARNLAGATWTLGDGDVIFGSENSQSQFINLGLIVQDGGIGEIFTTFYDRGGTIEVNGELAIGAFDLNSASTPNRFVDDTINGSGILVLTDDVLVGSNISTVTVNLQEARIVGDVTVSSANVYSDNLQVAPGATLNFTNPDAHGAAAAGADAPISFVAVDNNGTIESSANLVFTGALIGVGVVEIGPGNVTIENNVGPAQTFNFNTGAADPTATLTVDGTDSPLYKYFKSTITGFDQTAGVDDKIALLNDDGGPWELLGYNGTSGALDFTRVDGSTFALNLAGDYNAADFHTAITSTINTPISTPVYSTTITYG